jgi:hypothetical protein
MTIQLKNGYLKEVPSEYDFMRRFPPFPKLAHEIKRHVDPKNIPYMKYFEAARYSSPLYSMEGVYPAFWSNEPVALVLAKKQYEFVQAGYSEEEALKKATEFVEHIESKAYEKLRNFANEMKEEDALPSFISDPELMEELKEWKEIIAAQGGYNSLEIDDKGEVDFILQTKVLKWNEVERERRMRDPVFVHQFDRLRLALFPNPKNSDGVGNTTSRALKEKAQEVHGMTSDQLQYRENFYYEDYVHFFNMCKEEPLLARWDPEVREQFSRWIVDTLAVESVMVRFDKNRDAMRRYLDSVRAQYFPMIKYTDQAENLKVPDAQEMKKLLFSNDIGYKTEGGKLYVRRFYRIPMLLYPKITMKMSLGSDPYLALDLIVKAGQNTATKHDMTVLAGLGYTPETIQKKYAEFKNYAVKFSAVDTITKETIEEVKRIYNASSMMPQQILDSWDKVEETGKQTGRSQQQLNENKARLQELAKFVEDYYAAKKGDASTTEASTDSTAAESAAEEQKAADTTATIEEAGSMASGEVSLDDLLREDALASKGEDGDKGLDFSILDNLMKEGSRDKKADADDAAGDEVDDEFLSGYAKKFKSGLARGESKYSDKGTGMSMAEVERYLAAEKETETNKKILDVMDLKPLAPEEFDEAVEKYHRKPKTLLQKVRDGLFSQMEARTLEECKTEADLKEFARLRMENEVIIRARNGKVFNEKETARMNVVQQRRGGMIEVQPYLELEDKTEMK